MYIKTSLLVTAGLFAFAVILPTAAGAQSAQAHEMKTQAQERRDAAQQNKTQKDEEEQAVGTDREEKAKGKLEAAKLKACQKRQNAIQKILTKLSDRGTKQLEVFTKISDRTQAFYSDKGYSLANYDDLVAEATEKKTAAEAVVASTHAAAHEFNCEGDNPKAAAETFKERLKAQNAALKEYKTAVKELIVGVKSSQSSGKTTETTENTDTTEGSPQ